jgi:hypothetical protein
MKITLEKTADREWLVRAEDATEPVGTVSRKQTGYLVTKFEGNEIVKRFRLIDALRQSFGQEHTYITPDDTKPTEEGYV